MAVIDVAGFIADLKDHAADHGFHVHDERHFVETYSLRQAWEVDLHPEEACNGPLDLHLSLEVDPRQLLSFEDAVMTLPDGDDVELSAGTTSSLERVSLSFRSPSASGWGPSTSRRGSLRRWTFLTST